MPFWTDLVVSEVPPHQWRLAKPLVYQGARDTLEIPSGFTTDFASVPRPFWAVFPPYGYHTKAAVVHDWLYRTRILPRRDADGIFRRIMRELRVSWWRRWTMWAAVRAFGWAAWRKKVS